MTKRPVGRPVKMTTTCTTHCTCLLYVEAALREECVPFLGEGGEDGEEGGEREEGEAEAEESGETERVLVGLLLGEPRGEE